MDSQAAETLTFRCPACDTSLRVPRSLAGVRGPCPQCRVEISAPQLPQGNAQSPRRSTSIPGPTPGEKHDDQTAHEDYLLSSEPAGSLSLEGDSRRTDLPQNTTTPSPIHSRPRNIDPGGEPLTAIRDQVPVTTDISLPSHALPARTGKPQPQASRPPAKKKAQRRINLHPLSLILIMLLSAGSGVVAMLIINEFNDSPLKLSALPFVERNVGKNPGREPASPNTIPPTRNQPAPNPSVQAAITPPSPAENPSANEPATPPPATTVPPINDLPAPETGVDAARAALDAFLAAKSVAERIKHVQTPDFVTPKMEIYYSKYPLNLNVTGIAHELSEQVPQSDRQFHIFKLITPQHPSGFPVSVEETIHGCLVDWTSFVQFHDNLLGKFIRIYQPQPDTFHAILERAHYFRSDVPGLGSKFCFRIKPPIPGYEGHAFIGHDSPLAARVEQKYKWDRIYFPVLELQWVRTPDGSRYIEIKDIVQDSWRAIQ